ncbi:MAG TPA: hypothetical protein VFJ68_09740, partial [Casimicrobiaceae bacterium]|nr:hypothetical protein [Casimicrobiaceae bacterium]
MSERLDERSDAGTIATGVAPPRFCIVTPCKGRLQYLRQALPTFVVQKETEVVVVVVVDYDCPDRTKDWVAGPFPHGARRSGERRASLQPEPCALCRGTS